MRRHWQILLAVMALAWLIQVWWWLPAPPKPGESTYRGRSTSAWQAEIANGDVWRPTCGTGSGNGPHVRCDLAPSWWSQVSPTVGFPSKPSTEDLPLLDGDPGAIPVLLELLQASDPKVRMVAIEGFARMGDKAKPAVPALIKAMDDEDFDVGCDAAIALMRLEEEAVLRWLHMPIPANGQVVERATANGAPP
jgi:hypothetical protein